MGKAIGQKAPRHSGIAAGNSMAHRPAHGKGWASFKAGTNHSKHTEKAARPASGPKVIFKLNGKIIAKRSYTRTKTGDAAAPTIVSDLCQVLQNMHAYACISKCPHHMPAETHCHAVIVWAEHISALPDGGSAFSALEPSLQASTA
jgi:hypothetical protein